MKIWLFLFIIFNLGCGRKYEQFFVQKELQSFVDDFVISAKIRGINLNLKNIIIKLGDANQIEPQQNKIGYCLFQRDSGYVSAFEDTEETNIVVIDQNFFNRTDISDITRRELVFHELGHCVLQRLHNEQLQNNLPISIMNPTSVSMRYFTFYRQNEESYFDELFGITSSVFNISSQIEDDKKPILFMTTEDGCVKTK